MLKKGDDFASFNVTHTDSKWSQLSSHAIHFSVRFFFFLAQS